MVFAPPTEANHRPQINTVNIPTPIGFCYPELLDNTPAGPRNLSAVMSFDLSFVDSLGEGGS